MSDEFDLAGDDAGAGEAAVTAEGAAVGYVLERRRARRGKGADPAADRYLAAQEALAAKQMHHMDAQFRHLGLRLWSERLRLALLGLAVVAGLLLLGGLGTMAWRAHEARGVVIAAFASPPDMAARGITGETLASLIEDRVTRLQEGTVGSQRAPEAYSNDFGHDIKVEIPQTGVSIGELQRVLRDWLGHEIRVGGELFHTPAGLTLTIRIAGAGGEEFEGAEGDLNGLLQRAAEAVYGRTQPYRYGVWLATHGRLAEGVAVMRKLAAEGPPEERAWALSALSLAEPNPAQGALLARQALAIDPNLAAGWFALWRSYGSRADYEGYRLAANHFIAALERPDHGGYDPAHVLDRLRVASSVATLAGDFSGARRIGEQIMAAATNDRERRSAFYAQAYAAGLMHDPTAAMAMFGGIGDAEWTRRTGDGTETQYNAVVDYDDFNGAAKVVADEIDALRKAQGLSSEAIIHSRLMSMEAMQLARAHRLDEARAVLRETPPDCYFCMGARGWAAQESGDFAGADRWFEGIIAKTPHVAWAYVWLATAKLDRRDYDGAIAVAERGVKVGPRWADLHEAWGEALLAKGDARAAAARLATAAPFAPRWGRLHLKWGEALARVGKAEEARAQFLTAATMALSAADRAELAAQRT